MYVHQATLRSGRGGKTRGAGVHQPRCLIVKQVANLRLVGLPEWLDGDPGVRRAIHLALRLGVVQGSAQDRQQPVGSRSPAPLRVGVSRHVPVLLFRPGSSPQARWCLGQCPMPAPDPVPRQSADYQVPQRRHDMGVDRGAGVGDALPASRGVVGKVVACGVSHGIGDIGGGGGLGVCASFASVVASNPSTGRSLRLVVVQHGRSCCFQHIIGLAERRLPIPPTRIRVCHADQPHAAMGALAIAEGGRWTDAAPVGLMTGRQPLTSRAGGQGRIDDCARHCARAGYQVRYQEYDGVRGRSRPLACLTGSGVSLS
jgi:hypothetical protein